MAMMSLKSEGLKWWRKMRLRLAQLMHEDINVLILDEPTNHLDIEAREVLEETLESFEGTIIGVSHDRYFLQKIFAKTAWIDNQTIQVFEGDYEWAKQKDRNSQRKRLKNNQQIKHSHLKKNY